MKDEMQEAGVSKDAVAEEAMVFVRDKGKAMEVAFHSKPADLSQELLIKAFVVVTRFSNAVDRRKRELRKKVDELVKSAPELKLNAELQEVRKSFDGFALLVQNGSFGKKKPVEAKVFELLESKGIDKSRVMVTPPQPPPPPSTFSMEKFEALKSLDLISQDEFDACLEAVAPSSSISVEMPESVDSELVKMILGPDDAKPRRTRKKLAKGETDTTESGTV